MQQDDKRVVDRTMDTFWQRKPRRLDTDKVWNQREDLNVCEKSSRAYPDNALFFVRLNRLRSGWRVLIFDALFLYIGFWNSVTSKNEAGPRPAHVVDREQSAHISSQEEYVSMTTTSFIEKHQQQHTRS